MVNTELNHHFDPTLLATVLRALRPAPQYWIAYSGGLDSTALLFAAAAIRQHLSGTLNAIHLNHGLQPDAVDWEAHCQKHCAALAIPLTIRHLELQPRSGESVEAVARAARYQAFSEVLQADAVLLTAHHADDQAETLLLALLRGSGVQGLAAMPLEMALGAGRLVRPLLAVTRAALLAYAQTQQLDWIDDPSNALPRFDRNFLRQKVVPLLRERWPAVTATLTRSASHCATAARVVEQVAAQQLATLGGTRLGTLDIGGLRQLESSLQQAVLRLWLKNNGFRAPDTRQLLRISTEMLTARADARPLVTWTGCEIRRYRLDLFALPPLPPPPTATLLWTVGATNMPLELPLELGQLHWLPASDAASRDWTLRVQFGKSGIRCERGAGQSGELKRLYQAHGVPEWWRPYVPLVFNGEQLLAVAGVCHCQTLAAPAGTVQWMAGQLQYPTASIQQKTTIF
ncbi:tRNA lysidine(34) synthetase TilS [Chromatium okenii]|uniref:tRNA lysidine(34) synthetase TilS n=1 Tax=Chromatium okenii TaxID=61644 RepID=UPI0019072AAC|nr:tRNA lysidine(34) synthetase TilS [Chromatium okenii]MBK1642072.1 tRNA lysidine(34) synthetase TilS [Chromatium okenii]